MGRKLKCISGKSVRDGKIYVWRWEERRERRWLHLCCVNEGERDWEKSERQESASVYLSHLSLSSSSVFEVIWSSQPVSSRPGTPCGLPVCVCVCYLYIRTWYDCEWGGVYGLKGGVGCKEIPRQTPLTNHFVAAIAAQKYHLEPHDSQRNTFTCMHTHMKSYTCAQKLWWEILGVEWGAVEQRKSSFNRLFTEVVKKNTHPSTRTYRHTHARIHMHSESQKHLSVIKVQLCLSFQHTWKTHQGQRERERDRKRERENTAGWIWLPWYVQNKHSTLSLTQTHTVHFGVNSNANLDIRYNALL